MVVKLDSEKIERVRELFLKTPLYTPMTYSSVLSPGSVSEAAILQYREFDFDCYCIYCKKETTFRAARSTSTYDAMTAARKAFVLPDLTTAVTMDCQRRDHHQYDYVFRVHPDKIFKIGQYPSMEDIAASDIQPYRKVIEPQYFSELHRAGGLMSHGIGIGAFVYLRRIFERLIFNHHAALAVPIPGFETMGVDEKIEALKPVLPAALVTKRSAYAILSKGIHELDEETCKRYFPVVRSAIIAILEEDLQDRNKALAAKKLEDDLAAALGEIKSNGSG
ncbi:MAG: hypothetical protein KF810_20705 [Rhizobiaceae bacterium]|nr:hypothetical protein [Rhizobiaceae bacterium]